MSPSTFRQSAANPSETLNRKRRKLLYYLCLACAAKTGTAAGTPNRFILISAGQQETLILFSPSHHRKLT